MKKLFAVIGLVVFILAIGAQAQAWDRDVQKSYRTPRGTLTYVRNQSVYIFGQDSTDSLYAYTPDEERRKVEENVKYSKSHTYMNHDPRCNNPKGLETEKWEENTNTVRYEDNPEQVYRGNTVAGPSTGSAVLTSAVGGAAQGPLYPATKISQVASNLAKGGQGGQGGQGGKGGSAYSSSYSNALAKANAELDAKLAQYNNGSGKRCR
jgi:hypothetical protein